MLKVFITVFMFIGIACQAIPPSATPSATPDEWVKFDFGEVVIRLQKLADWEVYQTDYHLIMTEGNDPFRSEGQLNGLLVHMWVPTSSNLEVTGDVEAETIASILEKIVSKPAYVGVASYHHPIAFDWGGHDAAYYTLATVNGNISLVIAFKVADEHFIAVNISAPRGHEQRIRDLLPQIFEAFYINEHQLDPAALNLLPSPLEFPEPISATSPMEAISSTD